MGFAQLKSTPISFLRKAIDAKLVEINVSEKGLHVLSNREVAVGNNVRSGLFSVGELVNGNCVSTGNNFSRYGRSDSGDTIIDQYRRFGTFFTAIEDGVLVGNTIADRMGLQQGIHGHARTQNTPVSKTR